MVVYKGWIAESGIGITRYLGDTFSKKFSNSSDIS